MQEVHVQGEQRRKEEKKTKYRFPEFIKLRIRKKKIRKKIKMKEFGSGIFGNQR